MSTVDIKKMAVPNEPTRPFRLYVTHVDGDSHFLKISGQLDQQSSLMIESLFESARENLEQGIGTVPPAAIHEGIICAAKYKDGSYYRAKIISTANLSNGLVGVQFIDYGNKNVISLSTIRFLDNYDPMFLQLNGQASDYYLSRVITPSGKWEEPFVLKLQGLLCYSEYLVTIDAQTRTLPIISVQYKGNDLSTHLVSNRIGVALPVPKQELLLLQILDNQQRVNWSPPISNEPPPFTEHVPFLINQNFPNPASAMRVNQNSPVPLNSASPTLISQRLVSKASRNAVNLRAPIRQPNLPNHQNEIFSSSSPIQKPLSPKKSVTYKSKLLEVKSEHKVFISYAEEGPGLFAVQHVSDAKRLQDMMDEINKRPHSSLTEPPMIGTVCLGRMSGDRIICRAIVMKVSKYQCRLFFVDFGDTEMVSYYDIFDIPEEFVKPNVFAMRFCLSRYKQLEKQCGPHLNESFKQLVNGKVLTLKVAAPDGPPLLQYGELYLDNQNVWDILMANTKGNLQFKWLEMLQLGSKQSVLVSYVDSCKKFYIQLSDNIDELNAVMDAVKTHCKNSTPPEEVTVGSVCCARFPDDDEWYRAVVSATKGNEVTVVYVDYGNEQEVKISDLRTITPNLINLPAQAMKCALKGFENKPIEKQTSNQLEMLALEKTLMAQIVGVLSNDTMLVTLIDETEVPPLDVARRMNQLSQPRSNLENKVVPVRKESQEAFSSPENNNTEDNKKKSFRREKSFREDQRPREVEEFGHRGGSFRSREQKDSFDRSSSGRRSDKFGGERERGDRRRRDNVAPADERAEAPAQPSSVPPGRQIRDANRDRKKTKADHQERPKNWKKDLGGVGKRLRQAAEAASADAQTARPPSIQDRLKRDNRFNHSEENKFEERIHRFKPERNNRERDRNDNWGERRENWNQKREYRDNRSERGGRSDRGGRVGKSNFSPRERAERSYGSDSDKRSDRSFKTQDNGTDRAGRLPPYKNRSNFTPVQYKQLANPITLETPFPEPVVEIGSQQEVSVTWIISPEHFYIQMLSLQTKFLEMMHKIPNLYKGVKSYTGTVQVGSSVLARYPADGVLYRATVMSVQPFSKFIVCYVDFGNKQLVEAKDIWQLDSELMECPKMAVHCSLHGVAPADGEWKANPEIDVCFNAPRYQCVFQDCTEEQYKVYLWNNGMSVADMLVEKELAVATVGDSQSSVTLKDEPIDVTIIVGQQIMCRVTHVESYEKFFVQLDLDKAGLVESEIASFDPSKLQQIAVESLSSGVDCVVKHEDMVYRAIIGDATDSAAVRATLPDYGREITSPAQNFMILPTELSVYYYQSLECYFNNYTSESEKLLSLEELRQKLTGKKFIIYINDVDGIRLVSTLYDINGKKLTVFKPDEATYEEVIPLCARAVFNYSYGRSYVTHVESLNEVYLQRSAEENKMTQLLDKLSKFYEEGTPEVLKEIELHHLCAAKSSDGNWYRAIIVKLTEVGVKVQFSDYGTSEIVARDCLRVLDPIFFEPCALAAVASLGLTAITEDAVRKLKELTAKKEVQVTLAFGSDGWLANLQLDGVDLSLQLINENYATPQVVSDEGEPEIYLKSAADEPISLPEGCTKVYISHIDTPGHFWLQMAEKVNNIEEIQAELQMNAIKYPDIETREVGTICVAKYSADDQWYRAEILDFDADITTVRFIDYGNTDVLDNQPESIKTIPQQLKDIEKYAIKSSVNAIPTGTGQWSEPASEKFTQLVGDMSAAVDALIVLKDVTTYVDIFVDGRNLTDKLVLEGHATRSEDTDCGDLPSCFASHVNSPSEFWIQLESTTPELQAMEAAMVDAENFPALSIKEEGVICAAKYPEDGAWYRAQIIVEGSEGTEVLFMDYGNASITNELLSLPDELKLKPALSRKCALQKPRDIKAWSRKSEIKFNELAAEGATIFNIQFIAAGDISIVDLYLEGKSVTEELVGLCEEPPVFERPTPIGQDLHSSGKICHLNSLEEFYVHLDDFSSNLDKVTEVLVDAASLDPPLELKVGSVCVTCWDTDNKWYRAKILEFCDVGYHVQFIDYGIKAKCEHFRQVPSSISDIEPLAKCCRLAGFTDNESAKSKLQDLVDELVTFQIEFLDSLNEPFLIKLLLNGIDLTTVFKLDLDINIKSTSDCIEILDGVDPLENEDINTEKELTAIETVGSILNESNDSAQTIIENVSTKENVDDMKVDKDNLDIDKDATELSLKLIVDNSERIITSIEKDSEPHPSVKTEETLEPEMVSKDDNSKVLESPVKDKSSESLTDTGSIDLALSPDKETENKVESIKPDL